MIPVGVVLCDMSVGLEVGRCTSDVRVSKAGYQIVLSLLQKRNDHGRTAVADMAADPKAVVRVGVADMLLDAVGMLRTSRPLPTVDNVVQSDEDGSG